MGQVDFAAMRAAMVASQLRTSDVNDTAVIAAMAEVPREEFVPAQWREVAYIDRPIPLDGGRMVNPPLATGRLLTVAEITAGDSVLLLNDATGYTATVLNEMGVSVMVVDAGPRPANIPDAVLWSQGKAGHGFDAGAPYDAIIIDGYVEEFPESLFAQLVDGGRLVAGVKEGGVVRLVLGRKVGDAMGQSAIADMEMAAAVGFDVKVPEFQF